MIATLGNRVALAAHPEHATTVGLKLLMSGEKQT